MTFISLKNGALHAEEISLEAISKQFGTPTYIYSKNVLIKTFESFKKAFSKWITLYVLQ